MKTNRLIGLLVLTLSTLNLQLSYCFAQGTAFTYQGRLNDGASSAGGSYDLRFTIYDAAGGGIVVSGPLTNSALGVSNGLFSVTLDFGTGVFSGAGRWLEIAARTNGGGAFTTLNPRQQLTSTPYAIQSANAQNAVVAATASSVNAGNVSGVFTMSQLPTSLITNGASGVSLTGTFTGNGSSLSGVPGTMPWQAVGGTNLATTSNQGYVLTNDSTMTITLPSAANVGDLISISAPGTNAWQLFNGNVRPISAPWTARTSGVPNLIRMASSADGQKLVAVGRPGQLSTSADGGVTWVPRSVGLPPIGSQWWNAVASSVDGTKLVAAIDGGSIYTSTNSGATWAEQTSGYPPAPSWLSVASSADGTKLVATHAPGRIYTSTNSGVTWTAQTNGIPNATNTTVSVASSADGTKLVAVSYLGGPIYTSTNSGANWTQQNSPSYIGWSDVASSADGKKLAVLGNGYPIYTSSDSGVTWVAQNNSTNLYWRSIAMSADGSKLIACAFSIGPYPGLVAVSTSSGVNWTLQTNGLANNGNAIWYAVASSADGSKLAVGTYSGGQIFTSVGGPVYQNGVTGATTQFQYLGNGVWQPLGQSASQLIGTIQPAQLPNGIVTNGASGVNLNGTFAGNGAGVTNLSLYSLNSFGAINTAIQSNLFKLASVSAVGSGAVQVVTSDVDGDGRPDLIVGSALTRDTIVLTNRGGGIFGSNATYTVGLGYFPAVIADVNGDGKPDLIGSDYQTNILTVLTNNGSGRFSTNAIYTMSGSSYSVAAVDLNGDSKVDLIYADVSGALIVMTNNGTGSFGTNAIYTVSPPSSVVAADFNGDGKPDLICANATTNTLSVLTNNGVGGFAVAPSVILSNQPAFLYVADFNGDGRPDVICRESDVYGGVALVLTNNGIGGFGLAGLVPGDMALTYTLADLNGDGRLDLICPNFTTNTVTLLTNNGSGGFAEFSKVTVGNAPYGAAAADVNGDGSLDLISANATDSTVSILTNGNILTVNFAAAYFSGSSFTGGHFSGNGSGLTNLSASHLTSGTLPSSALGGTYTNALDFNNPNNTFTGGFFFGGNFNGDGSGLTGLNASFITGGTVPDERLSANVSLLGPTIESSEIANGTIVDADINSAAAIADTKLATITTSGKVANSALSANVSLIGQTVESAEITDGTIVDADINAFAGIADTKLATISTTGKVADTALSANVARRTGGNTFSGDQIVTNGVLYNYGGAVVRPANPGWATATEYDGTNNTAGFRGIIGADGIGLTGIPNQMFIGTYSPHPVKFFINAAEQMVIATSGNVGIGTSNPTNKLHVAGGVSAIAFVTTSDRNAKENFEPISPQEVLNKVAALPITTWNFKTMNDGRHMGPMAQDFYAEFGLGGGDTTITSTDPDGVALAAIQGLNEKVEARSKKLEAENAELKARLEKLETLLNRKLKGDVK